MNERDRKITRSLRLLAKCNNPESVWFDLTLKCVLCRGELLDRCKLPLVEYELQLLPRTIHTGNAKRLPRIV